MIKYCFRHPISPLKLTFPLLTPLYLLFQYSLLPIFYAAVLVQNIWYNVSPTLAFLVMINQQNLFEYFRNFPINTHSKKLYDFPHSKPEAYYKRKPNIWYEQSKLNVVHFPDSPQQ